MKRLSLILMMCLSTHLSFSQVHVNGYYKKNGTYVEPHYRSAPNSTKSDNYSTIGNVNPYTGKSGTVNPNGSNYSSYTTYAPTGTTIRSTVSNGTYSYRSVNGSIQELPNHGLFGNWINKTLNNIHDKREMRKEGRGK